MDRRIVSGGSAVVAYVPVLHRGYLDFFRRHRDATYFYVMDASLIAEFDYLRKEIRALTPAEAVKSLRAHFPDKEVVSIGADILDALSQWQCRVTLPDEDVCHVLAQRYLQGCDVRFEQTFLRWDRGSATAEHVPLAYRDIVPNILDRELMGVAFAEAQKSSDWWRQVGAVLVRDKRVILAAHNRHLPTDYTPYINGDPRNAFFKGVNIELGTVLHAEKALICEAARRGIVTDGMWLYVKTFPCPPCAKAIVACGISRCYFSEGYAMLDGDRVLSDAGVEIVFVPMPTVA